MSKANENKLLISDCCDRAFHLICLVPAKKEVFYLFIRYLQIHGIVTIAQNVINAIKK